MRLNSCVLLVLGSLLSSAAAAEESAPTRSGLRAEDEAPKGLSVVPWKRSEPGALPEGPLRLLDFPLEPLDPEVFLRELDLNKEVKP
ncbi:MAG: hypothetical protein ACRETN_01090 [Nevskiales bacterium]